LQRSSEGLTQGKIINAVLIYVAVGFVACQIALFTTCRPFSGYWAVPAADGEFKSRDILTYKADDYV
jgi:hypothetical protein